MTFVNFSIICSRFYRLPVVLPRVEPPPATFIPFELLLLLIKRSSFCFCSCFFKLLYLRCFSLPTAIIPLTNARSSSVRLPSSIILSFRVDDEAPEFCFLLWKPDVFMSYECVCNIWFVCWCWIMWPWICACWICNDDLVESFLPLNYSPIFKILWFFLSFLPPFLELMPDLRLRLCSPPLLFKSPFWWCIGVSAIWWIFKCLSD